MLRRPPAWPHASLLPRTLRPLTPTIRASAMEAAWPLAWQDAPRAAAHPREAGKQKLRGRHGRWHMWRARPPGLLAGAREASAQTPWPLAHEPAGGAARRATCEAVGAVAAAAADGCGRAGHLPPRRSPAAAPVPGHLPQLRLPGSANETEENRRGVVCFG